MFHQIKTFSLVWITRKLWDESVFLFSLTHSLQTFTAAKVWRCRSVAAGAVSVTRSRKTCRNLNSSSMSTRGEETRGSLPAETWDRRTSPSTSLPLLCILRTLLTWTSCFRDVSKYFVYVTFMDFLFRTRAHFVPFEPDRLNLLTSTLPRLRCVKLFTDYKEAKW